MFTVLELLIGKQRAEGMTDTEMGNKLGISRVHYNYIKNKKSAVNDKFIMKAYRAFPDIFLSSDIAKVKEDIAEENTDTPEKPPNPKLRRLWRWLKQFLVK